MKQQTILDKMREYIQDFREQLAKNDLDSLTALVANTKTHFKDLMRDLPDDCTPGRDVEIFIICVDRFGGACLRHDLDQAALLLVEMEAITDSMQAECDVV